MRAAVCSLAAYATNKQLTVFSPVRRRRETMKVGQCLWVVVVVCIGIMIGPSIAHALVCGQSGEIPTFTVTLDPNTVPSPPPEPHSPSSLELYRTKLEIFLQNTVEGYNRKLIAFGKNLDLLDQRFRNAMANGFCASTEYETLKDKLDLEQGKIG